jgi:hypothetical protein
VLARQRISGAQNWQYRGRGLSGEAGRGGGYGAFPGAAWQGGPAYQRRAAAVGDVELVYVEATPQQIKGALKDLAAEREAFVSLSVDPAPGVASQRPLVDFNRRNLVEERLDRATRPRAAGKAVPFADEAVPDESALESGKLVEDGRETSRGELAARRRDVAAGQAERESGLADAETEKKDPAAPADTYQFMERQQAAPATPPPQAETPADRVGQGVESRAFQAESAPSGVAPQKPNVVAVERAATTDQLQDVYGALFVLRVIGPQPAAAAEAASVPAQTAPIEASAAEPPAAAAPAEAGASEQP